MYYENKKKAYLLFHLYLLKILYQNGVLNSFLVRYSWKKVDVIPSSPNTHINYIYLIKLL